MKKIIRATLGIKYDPAKATPPVFLEGEEPGVFITQEYEVDVPEHGFSEAMMVRWFLDHENDLINEGVEVKWQELVDEDISEA